MTSEAVEVDLMNLIWNQNLLGHPAESHSLAIAGFDFPAPHILC